MANYFKIASVFTVLMMPGALAFADILPGGAQPAQINRAMIAPQINNLTPPGSGDTITVTASPETRLANGADKIKFKLNGIILVGNNVFSTEKLSRIYQADLHHTISLQRLLEIVQTITNVYRAHGYVLTRAILPVQKAKNGIVRIDIVEGKIDKVIVTGDPKKSARLVQKFGNKIAQSSPLQLAALEKYTLLANEIPGTEVQSVLTASPDMYGATDLYLQTKHQNITGYISYDNYRTRYIGPQQITANLTANSFLMSGDTGQVTVAKTPKGNELTFFNASYDLPINAEGDRFLIGGIHDKTHPLFVLQPYDINGTDDNYYGTFSFPVLRTPQQNLTVYLNANYENTDVTTFHQKLYTDQIRSIGLGASYNLIDRFGGANSMYADIRQGLPILGYTSNTNPATAMTSRPGGHAVYTKIDMAVSRLQPLFAHLSLYALLKGQYGFQTLLAAEQFPYGGMELGRGYDIAELLGDRAIAGTFEGRFDWDVNRLYLSKLQFYAFYDYGKVWNLFFVSNLPLNQSATSTGVGVRFFFNNYVSGNFTWAQPLTKQVAAEELIGRGRKPRAFFSLVAYM